MADVPGWLQKAAALGDAIGGLATAAAVVYGWLEFRAWKHRALSTDRAGAAARVAAVLDPFCAALQGTINQIELAAARAENEAESASNAEFILGEECGPLFEAIEEWHRRLESARFAAQAFLSEGELRSVRQAGLLYLRVQSAFEELRNHLRNSGSHGLFAVARDTVLPLHPEVGRVCRDGMDLMRRIARHEAPFPEPGGSADVG